jgi:hypothetical protein
VANGAYSDKIYLLGFVHELLYVILSEIALSLLIASDDV